MGTDAEKTYSVLMAVYGKEKPEFFRQSIESMLAQTLPFSDFVLVCDGALTHELNEVISWAQEEMGEKLQIIRLKENKGLGKALRTGVPRCRCSVIARMDSDDISRPDRCERQFRIIERDGYDLVSGTLQEFVREPGDMDRLRVLPRTSEEILQYAKKRNPFNHPCVMFRKESVLRVGSYQDFPGFEDYYLWIRMLRKGCKGYNVQEVILDMRTGNGMYDRRGGRDYLYWVLRFQRYLYCKNFITKKEYIQNCLVRTTVGAIPGGAREKFYHVFLRNGKIAVNIKTVLIR